MELSIAEENYLKALFHLTIEQKNSKAGTNQLAEYLGVSPASANAMLKRLREKELVKYERYGKLELSASGSKIAIDMIRRHRLWESFLYTHLNFGWDEIHEVAEQLEHIHSAKLISQLESFLGFPEYDPHGDAIPKADGKYKPAIKKTLASMSLGSKVRIVAVKDSSVAFLRYLNSLGLMLSSEIELKERREFDQSIQIRYEGKEVNVSQKFAENVYVSG
jgi:DtxR family transcriptional regulator, Mn-dependent transcriptional regulator